MALILGIESSCDESACAVVADGRTVLASAVASQIAKHAPHGGVVPELAAREHLKAFPVVLDEALRTAGVSLGELDAIAVTQGPGLIPALLVGVNFAKGLALANGKPLYGINHFLGHIYGAFLDENHAALTDPDSYPMLALVVSGGHTSLLLIDFDGTARELGHTIDDAAGEALDKAAKLLKLGYPGGPAIQKTATDGNPEFFHFPRPLTGAAGKPVAPEHRYDFSFSGVKTALLYMLEKHGDPDAAAIRDTAASFQAAIVDVLTAKTMLAAKDFQVRTIVAAGGVACNRALRERLRTCCPAHIRLQLANGAYCTDNAAMIAGLGFHHWRSDDAAHRGDGVGFDAFARLPVISQVKFSGRRAVAHEE